MKFMFVCMGAENLSTEQLSSILKQKGHTVEMAFDPALFDDKTYFYVPFLHNVMSERKRVVKRIVEAKPDAIGFSVFTDNYLWACGIAREVKKELKETPIIFGGIYPTTCPEVVLKNDFVDAVCVGEGDEALPELLDSMEKGQVDYTIRNMWFRKDGKIIENQQRPPVDLNALPYYDKELFEGHIPLGRVYLTVVARGCLFGCSFCSQNFLRKFKGADRRTRAVDNVITELKTMKEKYNYKEVDFKDNILGMDKKWLLEFLDRYKKEIGVPYRALSHVLCIDEDVARALKESGCHRIQFGIQSLNEETRRKYLLRPETNEQIEKALRICDKAGLEYSCDHMFGLPGESEDDQIKAARFYNTLKNCTRITCFWTTYFPKTALVDVAKSRNAISDSDIEKINNAQAGYYYCEGAVRDKQLIKTFKNYQVLFRIMPILPERLVDFILNHRIQRYFHLFPHRQLLIPIDVTVSCIRKDHAAFQYMHYYFLHVKKKIRRKIGLAQ